MSRMIRHWYWLIAKIQIENIDAISMCDILRYDEAVILPNAPDNFILLRTPHRPTEGRLRSFGITILPHLITDGTDESVCISLMHDAARASRVKT